MFCGETRTAFWRNTETATGNNNNDNIATDQKVARIFPDRNRSILPVICSYFQNNFPLNCVAIERWNWHKNELILFSMSFVSFELILNLNFEFQIIIFNDTRCSLSADGWWLRIVNRILVFSPFHVRRRCQFLRSKYLVLSQDNPDIASDSLGRPRLGDKWHSPRKAETNASSIVGILVARNIAVPIQFNPIINISEPVPPKNSFSQVCSADDAA